MSYYKSFFQKTNQIFRLYALLGNTLIKIKCLINQVIINQEQSFIHPIKNASFIILNLANQLHQLKSIFS